MKWKCSSASQPTRINWLDGSSTIHEGKFSWFVYRVDDRSERLVIQIQVTTDYGPLWISYKRCDWGDALNGCCGERHSPERASRKGEGRVRTKPRKETQ